MLTVPFAVDSGRINWDISKCIFHWEEGEVETCFVRYVDLYKSQNNLTVNKKVMARRRYYNVFLSFLTAWCHRSTLTWSSHSVNKHILLIFALLHCSVHTVTLQDIALCGHIVNIGRYKSIEQLTRSSGVLSGMRWAANMSL